MARKKRDKSYVGDDGQQRVIDLGRPECYPPFADNSIKTSRFTLLSFFPLAVRDQFRRNGNIYFLCIGLLMFLGYYGGLFTTSVSPWTTLGPLALVVSISLMQEGYSDIKRHRSDNTTNNHPCVVLRRAESKTKRDDRFNNGEDVIVRVGRNNKITIAFETLPRKNIRSGDLVIVRNREMIPADLILLGSSNDGGNAYIETSSIDGETNLKLRNSPCIPPSDGNDVSSSFLSNSSHDSSFDETGDGVGVTAESIKQAVERVVNMSLLGHPEGIPAVANPANADEGMILENKVVKRRFFSWGRTEKASPRRLVPKAGEVVTYVATLTSEPPNTHVNNYSGKLTLPPNKDGTRSVHAALNVENILLRGAVLRNTEYVIGVACFTGADTKLVMNSVATPSKFSQMDTLINRTVFFVLIVMVTCVCSLGGLAVIRNEMYFDQLWYVGRVRPKDYLPISVSTSGARRQASEAWPMFNLPDTVGIGNPLWDTEHQSWIQNTFTFITLLSNFVPLSLYVSVEMITLMMMLYIGWDLHMYHKESDTPAVARSSIVTDLGLVEYIFSDKTGTLTCNIMEFKRCSVDGHIFGLPMAKAAPKLDGVVEPTKASDAAHPLKHLLSSSPPSTDGFAGIDNKLTFNAEMFLRVMSICHTVVVEKDQVAPTFQQVEESKHSDHGKETDDKKKKKKKAEDGAPAGYAYQAESPDEGALVSAASKQYGFQLIGRNTSGVQISCPCPTLLADTNIVQGLKDGSLTSKVLASKTASSERRSEYSRSQVKRVDDGFTPRQETWAILAVNRFDSDRKRMSVLVRSPPELGSVPMLLCKGADSSMLLEEVCGGTRLLESVISVNDRAPKVKPESEEDNSELESLLGLQAHLGVFASEGLRTLVLGVKILTEADAEEWLSKYKKAATSLDNRDKKLTAVAVEIESNLHIVGATAIEDRLQDGVPETIANLGNAGIKLWVLTGDKRETAIEIGYSTKVLTSKMHLTEVVDGPSAQVKALVAMELMRHIKIGNLPDYQLSSLDEAKRFSFKSIFNCLSVLGNWRRMSWLAWRRFYLTRVKRLVLSKERFAIQLEDLDDDVEVAKRMADPRVQRRKVRELARIILKDFWRDPSNAHLAVNSETNGDIPIVSGSRPAVFERAQSAILGLRTMSKNGNEFEKVQKLALTSFSTSVRDTFQEEVLSMKSYRADLETTNFDSKKRTVVEKMFAVDASVRKGKLTKHLKNEYKEAIALDNVEQSGKIEIESMVGGVSNFDISSVKRGLVLEGAALKYLLGDPILEEMLFAVASCSDSVIACRVSPIQKALLLKMVRKYVSPTPTTLAIGDGANDVGMIQEAHIGVGISGLEGQQAVNSSDFAIAQFRYLEPLLLIHGRWNYMRMSKAILFFFYKNALLVSILMVFSVKCLYSGTPLFDSWIISAYNFVSGTMPIIFAAIFDRDLPREYVLRNPEVYASGQSNEFLSIRMSLRYFSLCAIHVFMIYYFAAPALQLGGGVTSAFLGLMGNWGRDIPGDGEGGDLQVFGTTIYSALIYTVTAKALLETRSLIWGEFPAFNCWRGKGEGMWSRMAYTWVGLSWFSLLFYYFFIYIYGIIGFNGPEAGTFFNYVEVSIHVFNTRSITWMVSILILVITTITDVTGKVFSDMFYPTQTQIHMEIAKYEPK